MNNEEFQRMSEETAAKLNGRFAECIEGLKECNDNMMSAMRSILQLTYMQSHIMVMEAKNVEIRFALLAQNSFFLRPYYRRKYRNARRNRIAIQRAMIRARITNAEDTDLISEFDKIDRMHL